jgi:hypothetical protein
MSKEGRIPVKLETFITYIVMVNDYLNTVQPSDTAKRGTILGMSDEELAQLDSFVKKFVSGDPDHPGFWDLHKDKTTKTQTTRQDMVDTKKTFCSFFRPILDRISGSASITNTDRDKLNIAHPVTSHTTPKAAIASDCFVNITMLGQCKVSFECRASADEARASKAEGADAVEMAYKSLPLEDEKDSEGNPTGRKIKPRQMMGPSEATDRSISTKALFTMTFEDTHLGNNLQMFFRWINTKHPDLAGPWSSLLSEIIS